MLVGGVGESVFDLTDLAELWLFDRASCTAEDCFFIGLSVLAELFNAWLPNDRVEALTIAAIDMFNTRN
jgi:hypothetical protein